MNNRQLQEWKKQFDFSSLSAELNKAEKSGLAISAENEEYSKFPTGYLHVLNNKGEVKIADNIIWYNDGIKHFVDTEENLIIIKKYPTKSVMNAPYKINEGFVTKSKSLQPGARAILDHGKNFKSYQFEFDNCFNGKRRKYIHQLASFVEPHYGSGGLLIYRALLYLRIKLEYNSSGNWYLSQDYRSVSWRLNLDINSWDVLGNLTNVSRLDLGGFNDRNGVVDVLLIDELKVRSQGDYGWYEMTISGKVYQAISSTPNSTGGSACNEWTNYWEID